MWPCARHPAPWTSRPVTVHMIPGVGACVLAPSRSRSCQLAVPAVRTVRTSQKTVSLTKRGLAIVTLRVRSRPVPSDRSWLCRPSRDWSISRASSRVPPGHGLLHSHCILVHTVWGHAAREWFKCHAYCAIYSIYHACTDDESPGRRVVRNYSWWPVTWRWITMRG